MKFEQKQSLELKITREQIYSIELLELNAIELDKVITEEVCENVILDYSKRENSISIDNLLNLYNKNREYNSYITEDKDYSSLPFTYKEDFRKTLEKDFLTYKLSKKEEAIGKYLINNLRDDGYLDLDILEVSKKFEVSEGFVEEVREKIKLIDRKGFASKNLKECLLIQIENKDILYDFINIHLEDLAKNKLNNIAKSMNISIEDVKTLCKRMQDLEPIPSSGENSNENTPYIHPEIFILERNSELEVKVIDSRENQLSFNEYYMSLLESTKDEEIKSYLMEKYDRAIFFLEAIAKRRATIRKIANAIVSIQREFFLKGYNLKVCNLKILSERLDLSESTISRAIKGKYVHSKRGVFPLKYFLVSGVGQNDISKDEILKLIEKVIKEEDIRKPYSDQKVLEILKIYGVDIKRRTVAKYRDKLGILPSNLRKEY
ncbi:MAG: RNA polymerase factor sigma-54 [Peptoniphilus lacydonensis]|uniref:RNA polymerase factor sigma-54 n=1 Tax=Peptoniphilus lacydonensis TaxID=1673725 RepID=UPI0008D954D4|nr:RNA polymerase factor sigma-54 [Peptoniphilus lacydonensis]MDU1953943.1 RNA polymerase factor sigma-54 [Peptoniphilus lacydonensis]MDU5275808.1 RNA polymerase factor sigma-54 [Peptoniphilus lacydonensis]